MKIKNIEELIELKNLNWSNSYTERQFEINNIKEFRYLLENYLDDFAFGVTYNTFSYTILRKDNSIYIRNDDTYKFKNNYEGIITDEYNLKDVNIDNIIKFITDSQNTNDRRIGIKFIFVDIDEDTQEVKELLNKGLMRRFYGEDGCEPNFVYLIKNENIIKNILSSKVEYNIMDINEEFEVIFSGMEMVVRNIWEDEVSLPDERIMQLIEDDLYSYIPENKQKEIFEAEVPVNKLVDIFNDIGREQLKNQLRSLLDDVDHIEFI